ncbi:PAS domain S-box protein [Natronorubrum sp. JWXQ-INN-674]|uniref:PAS domain S-box protein n=1 Tax=Natronorubrum halalkaliphilum TaxID=2691917 RepID=A0A6B0VME0_9EURY|nr:PAS domain S-box protein [Natronorubrum halalkaliphilum]
MTNRLLCLVADSDRRARTVRELSSRVADADVAAVSNPDEAASVLRERSFDCLVLGHDDPELDAIAVLERLHDRYPSLPVVVVPVDGSASLASAVLAAGGTDYVRRADGAALLAERVERAIDETTDRTDFDCCMILEAIDDAVVVYDPSDDSVVDINERLCDLVGCRSGDTCVSTLATLRTGEPADDETIQSILDRTLESGSQRVEWNCETAAGDQFWAELTFKRVDRDTGPLVIGLLSDVSARKQREQQLRSYQKAVEQAGHSIYITKPDGRIEYVNPAFEDVTGYSADEAIGTTPRLLKSGAHDSAFYRDLWGTILAGDVWENQLVNRRKNGDEYVVNQTIAPITDENDAIVNFVAVNADITDQKRRESQFRELHDAVCEWLEATTREDVATQTIDHLEQLLDLELTALYLYDDSNDSLRPAAISETADETFDTHPQFREGEGIAWQVFETGQPAFHDDVRESTDVYNRGMCLPRGLDSRHSVSP